MASLQEFSNLSKSTPNIPTNKINPSNEIKLDLKGAMSPTRSPVRIPSPEDDKSMRNSSPLAMMSRAMRDIPILKRYRIMKMNI